MSNALLVYLVLLIILLVLLVMCLVWAVMARLLIALIVVSTISPPGLAPPVKFVPSATTAPKAMILACLVMSGVMDAWAQP